MASTGKVACYGETVYEAFLKSIISTSFKIPKKAVLITIKSDKYRFKSLNWITKLKNLNFKIYSTDHTSKFLKKNGIENEKIYKIHEEKEPNVKFYLASGKIDLVINIPFSYNKLEFYDSYEIRRMAIDFSIPLITNIQLARLFIEALDAKPELKIKSWDEYMI